MKKIVYLFPAILFSVLLSISITSCEKESDKETCDLDEFCEGKDVTFCCEGSSCYYTYNDKTYPNTDEGRSQLSGELSCGNVSVAFKSTEEYKAEKAAIIARLEALRDKVWLNQ